MDLNECLVGGECRALCTKNKKRKLAAAPIKQHFPRGSSWMSSASMEERKIA